MGHFLTSLHKLTFKMLSTYCRAFVTYTHYLKTCHEKWLSLIIWYDTFSKVTIMVMPWNQISSCTKKHAMKMPCWIFDCSLCDDLVFSVYVIPSLAVQFGINCMSKVCNFTRQSEITNFTSVMLTIILFFMFPLQILNFYC